MMLFLTRPLQLQLYSKGQRQNGADQQLIVPLHIGLKLGETFGFHSWQQLQLYAFFGPKWFISTTLAIPSTAAVRVSIAKPFVCMSFMPMMKRNLCD